jgi:hypothetical protein
MASPPIALRLSVGITGHRDLVTRYGPYYDQLRATLGAVLAELAEIAAIAAKERSGSAAELELRMVSPLAEGTDRLAAIEASRLGYRLLVPMPFAQAEYEKDFDAVSRAEFRALLEQARADDGVVALDGQREDAEGGYRAVGQYVLDKSNLLLAVRDLTRPALPGGTSEIVETALGRGMRVVWISPVAPETAWLIEPGMGGAVQRPFADAVDALRAYFQLYFFGSSGV